MCKVDQRRMKKKTIKLLAPEQFDKQLILLQTENGKRAGWLKSLAETLSKQLTQCCQNNQL